MTDRQFVLYCVRALFWLMLAVSNGLHADLAHPHGFWWLVSVVVTLLLAVMAVRNLDAAERGTKLSDPQRRMQP